MSLTVSELGGPWRDPAPLERMALGAARWRLAQLVAREGLPGRVARIGRRAFDLGGPFPGVEVVEVRLEELRPDDAFDLVWCDFAFSEYADASAAITRLWHAVGDALVAVVDVHDIAPAGRPLATALCLRASPGLLAGLGVVLDPLQVDCMPHHGGAWTSTLLVGRRALLW